MSEPAATATTAPSRAVNRPAPFSRIIVTGLLVAVLLLIPTLLIYWILRLVGVPFEVSRDGGSELFLVGTVQVIGTVLLAGLLAGLLTGTFRTLDNGPQITALVLGILTALSCAVVLVQPRSVPWTTSVSLLVLHLLVGGGLTWALSRAVTSEDPPPGVIERLDARHPGAGSAA